MIEFFREDGLAKRFKAMRRRSPSAFIAAPFWGRGATELLGLADVGPLRVLCRFDSNGCNPEEMLAVAETGAIIRSNRWLHAKLYGTADRVIVGSSNASRNGITENGDVISGAVEGNVLTDDRAVVAEVKALFETLWTSADTVRVTKAMIRREIALRAEQPSVISPRTLRSRTLLAACREAPDLFACVYIIACDLPLDPGGDRALSDLTKRARTDESSTLAAFRNATGYQLSRALPEGAWAIDLNCIGHAPKVCGASQVPVPSCAMEVEGERDLTVTIKGNVRIPGARGVFKLSQQEKQALAAHADVFLSHSDGVVPLPEAVRLIDDAA